MEGWNSVPTSVDDLVDLVFIEFFIFSLSGFLTLHSSIAVLSFTLVLSMLLIVEKGGLELYDSHPGFALQFEVYNYFPWSSPIVFLPYIEVSTKHRIAGGYLVSGLPICFDPGPRKLLPSLDQVSSSWRKVGLWIAGQRTE
eukprot:scaffold7594_cov41-Attheya_sp.AAC.1